MKITEEQIIDAENKAYVKAGHNAYFGNGFKAGVEFALSQGQISPIDSVHPRFAVFSKVDDIYEQLSMLIWEKKDHAESFADAMRDTVRYFETDIVVLNVL